MAQHAQMTATEVKKQVRSYVMVFLALLVLTGVTVGISRVHLPSPWHVIVAMIVASIKAALVAAVFMHLNHEKKIIYWTVFGTMFFFFVLLAVGFY